MQKVEGSSPFSRLHEGPANRGAFVVEAAGRRRLPPRKTSQPRIWCGSSARRCTEPSRHEGASRTVCSWPVRQATRVVLPGSRNQGLEVRPSPVVDLVGLERGPRLLVPAGGPPC